MARVTQQDVAKRVGVSRQAVAFALSPNPQFQSQLGEATRQRIVDTAKQMRYVPNQAARRLIQNRAPRQTRRLDQVGLIYIPSDGQQDASIGSVCLLMLEGAEKTLAANDASITFVRVAEPRDWDKVDRMTRSGLVDGWLLYGRITDDVLSHLRGFRLPTVIIGDHRCTRPVDSVNHDYEAVGRMAVEHFAGLGHRRIGLHAGSLHYVYQEMILAGYRAAVKELGLDDRDELVWTSRRQHLLDWIRDPVLGPTALFIPERSLAADVNRSLAGAGISVPAKISLLGYEINRSADESTLARIHVSMAKVGERGASRLLQLAKEEQKSPRQEWIAPLPIIPGMSTAPPTD